MITEVREYHLTEREEIEQREEYLSLAAEAEKQAEINWEPRQPRTGKSAYGRLRSAFRRYRRAYRVNSESLGKGLRVAERMQISRECDAAHSEFYLAVDQYKREKCNANQ